MAGQKSPSSLDRHIGSRIRLRRGMIGMSQETLGEHLGITFQQIQKYEKGINRVGSGRLHEIGAILGTPVSFFFEGQDGNGADDRPASSTLSDLLSERDSLQLLQAFNAITDQRVRRAFVNMARTLAGQAGEEDSGIIPRSPAPRKAFSHSS